MWQPLSCSVCRQAALRVWGVQAVAQCRCLAAARIAHNLPGTLGTRGLHAKLLPDAVPESSRREPSRATGHCTAFVLLVVLVTLPHSKFSAALVLASVAANADRPQR